MLFEWKQLSDEHNAFAQTAFAKMHISVDWPSTRKAGGDAVRYDASIEVCGEVLRRQGDIKSMKAARLWCEQSYVDLLEKELERCHAAA